ncbi:MAG: sensor hybrid histidine kinase [Chthoniobacteraceae bacterium]|nr:sensor hybrid histidine kinase [Chthoniobacteraceae bacterium]
MLVMDDEPMVREILTMILRLRGYRVTEAENRVEVLALVTGFQNGTIDVLITDRCMPGISGGDLAERVYEARPEIKTIITSSYSVDEMAARHLHAPRGVPQEGAIDQAIRTILEPAPALQ